MWKFTITKRNQQPVTNRLLIYRRSRDVDSVSADIAVLQNILLFVTLHYVIRQSELTHITTHRSCRTKKLMLAMYEVGMGFFILIFLLKDSVHSTSISSDKSDDKLHDGAGTPK